MDLCYNHGNIRCWLLVWSVCVCLAEECHQSCTLCSGASDTYIWSPCQGKHCLRISNCTSLCATCQSVIPLCATNYAASSPCRHSSPVCGASATFTSSSGDIGVINSVAPLTLCVWTLDLRDEVILSSQDYVKLSIRLGESIGLSSQGLVAVATYTVFVADSEPDLTTYAPVIYYLDTTTHPASLIRSIRSNYMYFLSSQVTYWTPDSSNLNVGLSVHWEKEGHSDSNVPDTASIITIAAVSMVSTTALFCCFTCLYKYLRARQRRRIYLDRSALAWILQDRMTGRPLADFNRPLPYVTKEHMDQCMPLLVYQTGLLEVGEPVCTVCLEE